MENIKPNYGCAQKDFYTVGKMGWANYALHQAAFLGYKLFYTDAFGQNALQNVLDALALPDDQARGALSEMEREQCMFLGKDCLDNMQDLKGYIETAYKTPVARKAQYELCGLDKYDKAAGWDWESMITMNQSGLNYMNDSSSVSALTANLNMPPAFTVVLIDGVETFSTKYTSFLAAKDTSIETETKILATNDCYTSLIAMFKDAQRVFRNDAAVLGQFTFQTLLDSINPSVAGVRGMVKETGTNLPIVATIKAQKIGEVALKIVCGVDGLFSQQLSEGKYVLEVSAAGYVSQSMDLDLKLTGLRKLDIVMVKS